MVEGSPEPPNILAEINARIREVASRSTARADEWEFLCECGQPGCDERVHLSLDEYERMAGSKTPIVVESHR